MLKSKLKILNKKIKIAALTSSRADYGIYKNLFKLIESNINFDLTIIAFGMHLSKKFGETINEIKIEKFSNLIIINDNSIIGDKDYDIALGYSNCLNKFSKFWNKNKFDYILTIGDRFEMSAAVQAGIPYNLKFAHIHGGEITKGSIDDIYRDQISLVSNLHFTSNEEFSNRLRNLLRNKKNIYTIGSLSLEDLDKIKIPKWSKVCEKFQIPNKPFILITFHPETINIENNIDYIRILDSTLSELCKSIQLIITSPNADTYGSLYKNLFNNLKNKNPKKIFTVNSFGKENYFSAIKSSIFLLGNSSSGIIESASFNKYAINVGDRQLGRLRNKNIIDVKFDKKEILQLCNRLLINNKFSGKNKYLGDNPSRSILNILIDEIN